ncbi:hypothetical protein [Isorropodon fossajaponicum symbiont]|uniref:hypothetical protein n=1 Tax=Isorropodon fossajaponicum symbiont TaxID=883811 RepID=UPI001CECC70B|nr:hypothetical protein [Isorropodon fossajaponicum symbiont]
MGLPGIASVSKTPNNTDLVPLVGVDIKVTFTYFMSPHEKILMFFSIEKMDLGTVRLLSEGDCIMMDFPADDRSIGLLF